MDKTNKFIVESYRKEINKYITYHRDWQVKRLLKETKMNCFKNYEEKFPCWGCGKKITYYDEPNERVYCKKCKQEHFKEIRELKKQEEEIHKKLMLERAMKIIEASNDYSHEYIDSFNELKVGNYNFDSSHEAIVAMVLINNNYEFESNKKIGKYYIDFYIPEEKICLEIDGERHKNNQIYDKTRDIKVRETLGSDWETVRIPTEYVEKNPGRVIDAMLDLKAMLIDLRKKYGYIPDYFSERERMYYNEILYG